MDFKEFQKGAKEISALFAAGSQENCSSFLFKYIVLDSLLVFHFLLQFNTLFSK